MSLNNRDPIVLSATTERRDTLHSRLLRAVAERVALLLTQFFGIATPLPDAKNFVNQFVTEEVSTGRLGVLYIPEHARRRIRSVSMSRHVFGCFLEVLFGPVVPYYRWPATVRYGDTYSYSVFAYKVVSNGRIILACTLPTQSSRTQRALIDQIMSSHSSPCFNELALLIDQASGVVFSNCLLLQNYTVLQDAELFKRKLNEPHPLRKSGSMAGCKRRRLQ